MTGGGNCQESYYFENSREMYSCDLQAGHAGQHRNHLMMIYWPNRLHPTVEDEELSAQVNHPSHYGGENDPFEHVKVAEAKNWGYHIGSATKYIWRHGSKPGEDAEKDLRKAIWWIERYIEHIKGNA